MYLSHSIPTEGRKWGVLQTFTKHLLKFICKISFLFST